MYEYIVGKVNYSNSNYLILENNFIGYKIFVSDSEKFEINKIQRVYIYTKIYQNLKNNFLYEYYGFKTLYEKIFFEWLLQVNGVGTKIALSIMKNDINLMKDLIIKNDIEALNSLSGFTNKISLNVTHFINQKIKNEPECHKNKNTCSENLCDLVSALKALGYKKNQIEKAVSLLESKIINSKKDDISDLISLAIQAIVNHENIPN